MKSKSGRVGLKILHLITLLMVGFTGILLSLYFQNRSGLILSFFFGIGSFLFFFIQWVFAKIFRIRMIEGAVEKDQNPDGTDYPYFFGLLACSLFCTCLSLYLCHLLAGANIPQLIFQVLELKR